MTPQFIGLFRSLPRVVFFCAFFFFGLAENLYGQCAWYSTNIACTTPAPTVVGSTISCTPPANNGGRRNFQVTGMVAGCTYRISNCGSGFDTQMTIFDAVGTVVGFNDDNGPACTGTAASIDFTCPTDGTYNIQLNRSNCAVANNLNGDITVTLLNCAAVVPGYNMANGIQTLTCGGAYNFFDSSGPAVDYLNSQNIVETFVPSVAGQCVNVTFTSFASEAGLDRLIIRDGNSVTAPVIVTLSGLAVVTPISFTSSGGALTFEWISDGSIVYAGWSATIQCTGSCAAPPPPCSDCTTATVINSIPFTGSYTTCGACDDVQDGDACSTFYLGGEDYLFSYTPATSGAVDITLTGTLGYTGIVVTEGCPTAGGICVDGIGASGGNPVLTGVVLTAGVTYYFIVDTWPTPDCTPFTIEVETTPPPVNDDPCGAIALPVNLGCVMQNYTTASSTGSSVPNPGCAGYSGSDVWFSAVVPADGAIVIDTQTGDLFDGGMAAYSGSCGSLTLLDCDDDGSANGLMPSLTLTGLTPGQTIYIRIWSNGNLESGIFGICASEVVDCGTAVDNSSCGLAQPFCTGTSYSYCNTTAVPSLGGGGIYGCLGSTPNPAFFFLNVETSGAINFTITQESYTGTGLDVDYVIWGPFPNQGAMCGGLSAGNIVSCSYSIAAIENATIPAAVAGQWYMLLITNFSNQPGFVNFEQTNTGNPGAGETNCNILSVNTPTCTGPTYTLSGSVTSSSPPSTGTLTLTNSCDGSTLVYNAPFPSTLNFTFPNLCSNGTSCTVTGVFSAGSPTLQPVTYTAPNCNTFTAVPTACSGGAYSVSGTLSAGCLPSSGTLTIASSCGGSPVVYNAPFASAINYTLTGLCGNGGSCSVTAVFSDPSGPTILPATYTAPNCNALSATPGACVSGSFPVTGTLNVPCPPSTGTLTISSSCGGTPAVFTAPFATSINYSILNIPQAFGACTITATFSAGGMNIPTASIIPPTCCSPLTVTVTPSSPTICSGGSGIILTGTVPASGGNISISNTADYAIPDAAAGVYNVDPISSGGSWAQSPIAVSAICPTTFTSSTFLQVCLNINHTWDGDLTIWLRAPSGQWVMLSQTNGGSANHYNNTCFTTVPGISINAGTAPFTGTFNPEQSFNGFNGTAINGTWTLYVGDYASGDAGTLLDWTISFAQPTVSYAWSPTTGLSPSTSLTPLANPTSTTTYTLTANNSCGCTGSAQATVNVVSPPSAGTNGAATVCGNGSSVNLFSYLGGTPANTGTWTGPSVTSGGYLGTYNPVTMTPGVYTYTVTGTAPCGNATATVTVTETTPPNAGTNGSATLCSNGSSVNLFSYLGGSPSTTGSWSGTNILTGGYLGTYNPSTQNPGVYTYTVPAVGACPSVSATVTVTESTYQTAGTGSTPTFCASGSNYNLFSYISGSPSNTGVWTGPSALGGGNLGTFNTATNSAGVYTYTVTPAAPCPSSSTTVTVNLVQPPNPGLSGTATICSGGSGNLFSSLGGTPATTGVWTGPTTLTGGYLGTFTLPANTAGIYTYTVAGSFPCLSATSTVNVSIVPGPTATVAYPANPFCSNDGDSNPTITGTTGGTFSASPAGLSINSTTGAIQPSLSASGTYTVTYTIAASGGCPVFTTTTTVQILEPLQIYVTGTNPTCATSCDGSANALVTGGLPPYSYAWSGSGSTSATATGLCEGTYTATVTDAAGCVTSCTPVVPAGCFQIQGILVDACGLGSEEGLNEMVFFQVGSSPLATSGLAVTWATANTWQGLCTNPTFIANVNATITGGGSLIAAPATLPAGANVVLITSSTTLSSTNLFTDLTGPLYVLFHCGSQTSGNFTNSSGSPGLKTLTMTFNGSCTDQVSYLPGSLTTNVNTGSNGASVVYTSGGVPTYVNYGCSVPSSIQNCDVVLTAPPFDVVVSPLTSTICEGSSVVLSATGADSYTWSPSGTLSAATGASVTATPTITTVYSVTGITGPCSETETVTVNINSAPTATVVYNGSPFCSDITSPQAPVISGASGGSFSASPSGLSINALTGAITPSSSSPGTYTVTYTIPASGTCPSSTTSTSVTITLSPAVPTLTPTNPCSGTGVVFTAGNGAMYEFFVNGVSQGPSSTTNTFTSGTLNGGDQVCVRSTPPVPFVMNGNINEPEWGSPLSTSSSGPATSGFGTDNRIDAIYLRNMNGLLYGAVAGNEHDGYDQANNNWILLFIDSKPGGFNSLSAWTNRSNVPLSTNGLLNLALAQNVVFDAGFAPDYILCMNQASATAYFDLYDMQANVNTYLGNNVANPSKFGFIGNSGTGDFTHGFEFTFPLSQIGSPASSIQAFAMMVNDPNAGVQTFLSNQFLSPANSAQGNFGNGFIDFNNQPPSPVSFMLSGDCFEETCVTVLPTITPTFNPIAPICYGDAAPILPTTSTNGISGTWSPSVSNVASGTYTFTPTLSQCANSTTLSITVNPETLTTPIYHD